MLGPPGERVAMLGAAWSVAPLGRVLTQPLDLSGPSSAEQLNRLALSADAVRPGGVAALVCAAGACRPPVHSPRELRDLLRSL